MPQQAHLLKGYDPVAAGRLGLWLLSRRSHHAAQKRVAFPEREWRGTLSNRFERLICQWHVYQYPGARIVLAAILGIAPSYARQLLKPGVKLPAKHARKMADFLGNHASQCDALAHELRDYAQQQERSKIYDKRVDRRKKHP